jgi:hypothetical protein
MLVAMPFSVMLAIVLIGAGAVAAAVVGLLLPENHWVGVGLALVLGAGVGVVVLAIGLFAVGSSSTSAAQNAFLVAAAAGLVAVIVALSVLWRRVRAGSSLPAA